MHRSRNFTDPYELLTSLLRNTANKWVGMLHNFTLDIHFFVVVCRIFKTKQKTFFPSVNPLMRKGICEIAQKEVQYRRNTPTEHSYFSKMFSCISNTLDVFCKKNLSKISLHWIEFLKLVHFSWITISITRSPRTVLYIYSCRKSKLYLEWFQKIILNAKIPN